MESHAEAFEILKEIYTIKVDGELIFRESNICYQNESQNKASIGKHFALKGNQKKLIKK